MSNEAEGFKPWSYSRFLRLVMMSMKMDIGYKINVNTFIKRKNSH
jgi:hypothetical protein